ncbi:MAG TPA: HNH endonuclease [Tepidisphaeraceae bacterium]|nr:HNH endonuclease [Tepidisphaeraceae bacterium]
MSKYTKLAEYLRHNSKDQVRLAFADIERILGATLPPSAYKYKQWWQNSRSDDSHVQAREWQDAGWEKEDVNLAGQRVTFRRVPKIKSLSSSNAGSSRVASRGGILDIDTSAWEGYVEDFERLARKRNLSLARKRKKMDDFKCQACGFKLQIAGMFVLDVHHINPLSLGRTRTSIEDIISLCPTCHRIAHCRRPPYGVIEVKRIISTCRHSGVA